MIANLVATALVTVAAAVGAVPVEQTVGAAIHDAGSAALGEPQIGTAIKIEGTDK